MMPGVLLMTPKTKRQNSELIGATSPRPKKLKFKRFCIKTILIILFNSQGIVHKEIIPEGKTVNAENELKRLHFEDVAEIQEAIKDELKKVQKKEFSTAFQKL